jgi:SPP1 gp7 family putative phage head morphogenesis protein
MEDQQRKQGEKPKKRPTDAEVLVIIAGALAMGASAKATAATLSPLIGIPAADLLPLLIIAMARPIIYGVTTIPSATASAESSALEPTYRAQYVLAAARRLSGLEGEEREEALRREQRYFNLHIQAVANRRQSAANVDKARARYGNELGWYAKMDSRTSAECREANGKNFSATRIPPIGWPGSVHPHCRCKAGKRHATSVTVYTIKVAA